MPDDHKARALAGISPRLNQYAPYLLLFYLLVAFLVLLSSLYLAIGWFRLPFIGAFIDNSLRIIDAPPLVFQSLIPVQSISRTP